MSVSRRLRITQMGDDQGNNTVRHVAGRQVEAGDGPRQSPLEEGKRFVPPEALERSISIGVVIGG
jgi:hypothetical protein